ncbi:MAG: hypothetical protein M1820_006964 [Bogoriella megaspora]|nr:MAG: hypothetical protein M1820_006964 [Bogoriella megaspora]
MDFLALTQGAVFLSTLAIGVFTYFVYQWFDKQVQAKLKQKDGQPKPKKIAMKEGEPNKDDESDDEDDDEDEKAMKKQQRERLKELGYYRYLKSHANIIPNVWPSGDRTFLVCIFVMVLSKVVDSTLNILRHHQESQALDTLWKTSQRLGSLSNTTSPHSNISLEWIPYKEVALWLLLNYLGPSGIVSVLTYVPSQYVEMHFQTVIHKAAFNHVMRLPMSYHDNKASYDTLNAMAYGDTLHSVADNVLFSILPMFVDLISAYVYFFFRFDAYISLMAVVATVLYVWLANKTVQWVKPIRKSYVKAWQNYYKLRNESVTNWRIITSFNLVDHQTDKYTEAHNEVAAEDLRSNVIHSLYRELKCLPMELGLVAVCLHVAYRILHNSNPVGDFVFIAAHWRSIQQPLRRLAGTWRDLQRDFTELERFFNLMLAEEKIKDAADAQPLSFRGGEVAFNDVSFSYSPTKTTLQDINFVASSGKTIAFVGETGGGKSTLLKLIPRFYDVSSGSVTIDGQDIREVTLESLRATFGIVPQNATLFNTTVMENVRYGRLSATDEEIFDACRAAAIHDKILTFDKGYESKVGEGGIKLSGGELQRISIARTILKQPRVVLLDEATSAVDTETEGKIQMGLEKLCKGRTTFVVAHRLSTVMHADCILVVDGGKIVERGTHGELLEQGGRYATLVRKQFGMEKKAEDDLEGHSDGDDSGIESM